jgi:hypothetical protein
MVPKKINVTIPIRVTLLDAGSYVVIAKLAHEIL